MQTNYADVTRRLDNSFGLHPDYGNWKTFLETWTDLKEEYRRNMWYVSSNHHYIVNDEGDVYLYFGYHGTNAWNRLKDNVGRIRGYEQCR